MYMFIVQASRVDQKLKCLRLSQNLAKKSKGFPCELGVFYASCEPCCSTQLGKPNLKHPLRTCLGDTLSQNRAVRISALLQTESTGSELKRLSLSGFPLLVALKGDHWIYFQVPF